MNLCYYCYFIFIRTLSSLTGCLVCARLRKKMGLKEPCIKGEGRCSYLRVASGRLEFVDKCMKRVVSFPTRISLVS